MNAIYGLFSDRNSARRALAALRGESRLAINPENIVIIASEPLEEDGFGWKEQRTPMPWISAVGGLLGGTAGYTLAAFTQRSYPLPTGGMPIVAMWPTGIIMYELTMLGVILTTIITFLITSRLPNFKSRLYDPDVTNGRILVGITDPDHDRRAEIEDRLYLEGAESVRVLP